MKKILIITLLFPYWVLAQDSLGLKLDELRAPSSPGFSILGVQPTDISRPKSWRSAETTLASSFLDGNKLIVPKNFAIEFNPFFTTRRLNPNNSPSFVFSTKPKDFWTIVKCNSAISVATGEFKNYYDTSFTNPRMGLGYRTQLFAMQPTTAGLMAFASFQSAIVDISMLTFAIDDVIEANAAKAIAPGDLVDSITAQARFILKQNPGGNRLDSLYIMTIIEEDIAPVIRDGIKKDLAVGELLKQAKQIAINATQKAPVTKLRDAVASGLQDRYGFCLEFATAFLLDFPTNDIEFSKVPKFGFWFTGTYRSRSQHCEIGGMVRFVTTKFDTTIRYNNFDLGVRAMLAGDKWSVNGEFIQRFQFNVLENKPVGSSNEVTFRYSADFKLALTVNYKLNDDVIFNYTFGNNLTVNTEFERNTSTLGSTVGVTYAFGGPTVKDIQSADK
ncbi:MAG TPA: hypothetical protein VK826_17785 [Bacteroidia bacterium]|nr:hypothetical protein [Bacteroidia bacterium]